VPLLRLSRHLPIERREVIDVLDAIIFDLADLRVPLWHGPYALGLQAGPTTP
jgi:hypothetical protein